MLKFELVLFIRETNIPRTIFAGSLGITRPTNNCTRLRSPGAGIIPIISTKLPT